MISFSDKESMIRFFSSSSAYSGNDTFSLMMFSWSASRSGCFAFSALNTARSAFRCVISFSCSWQAFCSLFFTFKISSAFSIVLVISAIFSSPFPISAARFVSASLSCKINRFIKSTVSDIGKEPFFALSNILLCALSSPQITLFTYCAILFWTVSSSAFHLPDSSLSCSCSFWNRSVLKICRNIFFLSSVGASSNFRKSPWEIIAICENWLRSIPIISRTALSTSRCLVSTLPSG